MHKIINPFDSISVSLHRHKFTQTQMLQTRGYSAKLFWAVSCQCNSGVQEAVHPLLGSK